MHRHTHRIALAALVTLVLALCSLPAAAGPVDVGGPHQDGWTHSVTAWFSGVVDLLVEGLPWAGSDDVESVRGAGTTNSHPTMDPNGVALTDPNDQLSDGTIQLDPES